MVPALYRAQQFFELHAKMLADTEQTVWLLSNDLNR